MRIAIVGTGLIGCSVALAARASGEHEVVGFDSDQSSLDAAVRRGALEPCESLEQAVSSADITVVAVPVSHASEVVTSALRFAREDALVTDVGSVKGPIVEAVEDPRFVAGHPLAGGEAGGADRAQVDLFTGATWYLTPVQSTAGVQLERCFRFIGELGAKPRVISPQLHDRILATVSHLPHVFANVLVDEAAAMLEEEGEPLPATGPSFRDATRVAGAPSSIWTDIYLANATQIAARLRSAELRIAAARELLEAGDASGLTQWNDAAFQSKAKVQSQALEGDSPTALRVRVPNRPGVLAELALKLGDAGIDLVDLQLHPAADRASGVIVVWVEGDKQVQSAQELIRELGHTVSLS